MDLTTILKELYAEKERIDRAISALEAVGSAGPRAGRPRKQKAGNRLSAAGRRRISQAMKKRWSEARKKKAA